MADTAIVGENIEVLQMEADASRPAFSWGVAIAGALAATAVSLIIITLGSGIGLSLVSPYGSSVSAGTLTIAGAVWLILAHVAGFATGGYLAGRMRVRSHIPGDETKFRDAAHGFMTWVIAVILSVLALAAASMFAAGTTAVVTGMIGAGAAAKPSEPAGLSRDASAYYLDMLFRPGQGAAPQQPAGQDVQRDEVGRILAMSLRNGKLADEDRTYIARVVAARTGLSEDEAQKRVTDIENRTREAARQAAETARKAASYASFWTFMALLMGAVAATLGGMLGGELRDDEYPEALRTDR